MGHPQVHIDDEDIHKLGRVDINTLTSLSSNTEQENGIDLSGIFGSNVVRFGDNQKPPVNEEIPNRDMQILSDQTLGLYNTPNRITAVSVLDPVTLKRYLVVTNLAGGVAIQPL